MLVTAWACLALQAAPEGPPSDAITVDVVGCESLDGSEIERVLRLELSTVTETGGLSSPLEVTSTCRGESVEISVLDQLTGKQLTRRIPAPPRDADGRERIVALAISQLFVASWLELLMPPKQRPRPNPAVAPEVTDAAREVAATGVRQRRRRTGDLHLGAGARWHALDRDSLPAIRAELGGVAWFHPSWGLLATVAYEGGNASRSVGEVRAHAVLFGVGATFRWPAVHVVSVEAAALVEAGYLRFEGFPGPGHSAGPPADGVGGGVGLTVGPRVRGGRVFASLRAGGGFMVRAPEALVARGSTAVGGTVVYDLEDPVSLGGAWAGAQLRIGLEIGPRTAN